MRRIRPIDSGSSPTTPSSIHISICSRRWSEITPWPEHREGYEKLGHASSPDLPNIETLSKEAILRYLDFCLEQVEIQVNAMDCKAESGFHWLPFNKQELQFYNIRHIQQHTGELCERLGTRAGIEVNWVGKGKLRSNEADRFNRAAPQCAGRKSLPVTGGSRTLGAEIVRTMANHGCQVAINYHRSAEGGARELSRRSWRAKTAPRLSCSRLTSPMILAVVRWSTTSVRRLGPIDILVNNVGPYVDSPFLDMPLADFDRILAGNVRATFLLSQIVGRQMKARGHGHIINIAATDVFHRSHSIYGLAKSGVIHLTEAMALELAPEVRVNAIAPDLIADNEDMTPEFTARPSGARHWRAWSRG
jgi:gluconate 5-dehydrogenase